MVNHHRTLENKFLEAHYDKTNIYPYIRTIFQHVVLTRQYPAAALSYFYITAEVFDLSLLSGSQSSVRLSQEQLNPALDSAR